jgi:uracil-DNA glycosylase family 4
VTKQERLDQIAADIVTDHVCPHLAETAKHLVMGEGSVDTKIIFIGEAPGKNEDEQGRPFIGAAGKVLEEMLASINLQRSDVFITSILKYRPPNNRDPLPDEKEAFWPYLLRQIKVIEPELIVTLGRHSMECFLPKLSISKVHGQPKRRGDLIILPLFHPAAALYNASMKPALLDDFKKVPKILEQIEKERNIE